MSHDHEHNNDDVHVPHLLPMKVYTGVGLALIFLTVFTVVTAKIEPVTHAIFGYGFQPGQPWNIIIALIIASTKALLVAFFFMHLKYDAPFMRLTFFSGLFFLSFFFIFTLVDTLTREKEAKPQSPNVIQHHPDYTPKGYHKDDKSH